MPEPTRIRELFHAALDCPTEQRAAFLARACAGDAPLRAEVESLLAAHDQAEGFLDDAPAERPGDLVGRYVLRETIGEGGFGVVWRAEQQTPIQREVALKLLKPGMDSRQVVARFEIERQTLAWLDHPHIAKVYDAGTHATGRPFFVMELVPGRPITAFCDEQRLPLRARVALLRDVCLAIDHAHRRGVIHRDLKPSNVLVAATERGPAPKVIDFGIAKATAEAREPSAATRPQQVLGTLEAMAPEQAASAPDVDTRADVWGLGGILYELLAGVRPFSGPPWPDSDDFGLVQRIRSQDAPRPSRRFAALPATLQADLAARRLTEPGRMRRLLAGELDWIVQRALERDRDRRYRSAAALADDLQRWLTHEPVLASPPSRIYRLRKFTRRHALAVTLACTALVTLLGGLVLAAVGWRETFLAQQHTERVLDLTVRMLATTDPHTKRDADWTVREFLTEFARELDRQDELEPDVEARLRNTLGSAYRSLGLAQLAEPQLARALELRRDVPADSPLRHRQLGASLWELGWLRHDRLDWSGAEQLLREALVHAETAGELGARLQGETRTALADVLRHQNELAEAEREVTAAIALLESIGDEAGPSLSMAYNGLGMVHLGHRNFADAERWFARAVDGLRSSPIGVDLELASALTNVAGSLRGQGRAAEAEPPMREAVELRRKLHGEQHVQFA